MTDSEESPFDALQRTAEAATDYLMTLTVDDLVFMRRTYTQHVTKKPSEEERIAFDLFTGCISRMYTRNRVKVSEYASALLKEDYQSLFDEGMSILFRMLHENGDPTAFGALQMVLRSDPFDSQTWMAAIDQHSTRAQVALKNLVIHTFSWYAFPRRN